MSRIPDDVVQAVLARADGYCEVGGAPYRPARGCYELHHRKKRGSGGKGDLDTVGNLLVAHGPCHELVHNPAAFGLAGALSWEHGWMLRAFEVPEAVPAQVMRGLCARSGGFWAGR